jgi:hypothetical protein
MKQASEMLSSFDKTATIQTAGLSFTELSRIYCRDAFWRDLPAQGSKR